MALELWGVRTFWFEFELAPESGTYLPELVDILSDGMMRVIMSSMRSNQRSLLCCFEDSKRIPYPRRHRHYRLGRVLCNCLVRKDKDHVLSHR